MPQAAVWRWRLAWASLLLLAAGLRFYALFEVPATLWVDEAWFEYRAREIRQGGDPWPTVEPVFAIGNSPYQIYATLAAQALGAPAPWSARWVSALSGLLGVAATGLLLAVSLRPEWPADERPAVAALTGAGLLAGLFAGLLYSRDGTQNTAALLWTALVLLGLFQAFTTRRAGWAVGAGAALAVALTTYEAAYFLPLILIAYALARAPALGWRPAGRIALLIGFTTLALGAPLWWHYLQHPAVVLNRLSAAAGEGLTPAGALADLGRVAWGLIGSGDQLFGQNLSGRPLFDLFGAALLVLGMTAALRAARRSPGAQLLLLAAAILALPSALSANAPAFTRMLPMLPALLGLAGWGAAAGWGWARERGRPARWGVAAALAAGVLISGAYSAYDYFVVWAHDPRLFDARQVGVRRVIEQALARRAAGDEVWVTARSHPFAYYAFALALDDAGVRAFDAAPDCLPYAHRRPTATSYGVIALMDPLSLAALQAAYPAGREPAAVMHPDGYAYAVFWQVPAGMPAPAPEHPVDARWASGLRLAGWDGPATAAPGQTITLRLHWEAAGPLFDAATGFAHLGRGRDSQPMLAQHDGPLCPGWPAGRWEPGYRYIETRALTLATDAPAGGYDLRVGVYDPATGARLPVAGADRPVEDDRLILTDFIVP